MPRFRVSVERECLILQESSFEIEAFSREEAERKAHEKRWDELEWEGTDSDDRDYSLIAIVEISDKSPQD